MATYTRVNTLKINRLTKAQYSTITPSTTELYVITDEGETLPVQTGQSGKFLTTNGTTASWVNAPTEIPTQSGNSGKFLKTDGSSVSWATVDALPSQSGQTGKFLTTNGSNASWANVDALPSQTGNNGKFLTTDGTTASWATSSGLPSQSGYSGAYLTTNGTTASWQTTTQIYPVIETYSSSTAWYRIYATDSSGYKWCEQGGILSRTATGILNVSLSKSYTSNNYTVLATNQAATSYTSASTFYTPYVLNKTTSGFSLSSNAAIASIGFFVWETKGYISG